MRLPKVLQKYTRKINKALDEWQKYGVSNNDVRYAESLLASFHEMEGKKLKKDDRINARMSISPESMNEYIDLIVSISEMDIFMGDIYDEEIMKRFEKAKGKRGIDNLQDYVDFIDNKNVFMKENVIASILSWYEYEELKNQNILYGKLSTDELNKMILDVYYDKGLKGEELYDFIFENI